MMSAAVSTNKYSTRTIASIGVLSALAVIVMLFEIPLPFLPPFYKLGFDEVIVMIGGFALGPLAAVWIEGIKIILNLMLNGTITAGVGEFANFLMGCSFVLPAAIIYKHNKTRKNALKGLIVGSLSLVIVGCFLNYFIVLPMYSKLLPMPMDALIDIGTKLNGSVDSLFTFVVMMTAPFNLIKAVLSSLIVFLSYKKISVILKH